MSKKSACLKRIKSQLTASAIYICLSLFSAQLFALDFSPLPFSQKLEQKTEKQVEYRLVLSELQHVSAVTSGEQEFVFRADVSRQFWQLQGHKPMQQILQHYLEQLGDGQVLYQCVGIDCGSSNFWANTIFDNAQLYGRDDQQAYAVIKQAQQLYVMYFVQRSKKVINFTLEQVNSLAGLRLLQKEFLPKAEQKVKEQPVFVSLSKQELQEVLSDYDRLQGWLLAADESLDLAPLAEVVKSLTTPQRASLKLVVHCYKSKQLDENLKCSDQYKTKLEMLFKGRGVDVFSQGSLLLNDGFIKQQVDQPLIQIRFVRWPLL